MTLIDNAVYVNGHRTADPRSLEETYEVLRDRDGLAWIGLYRPDVAEIRSVATEFELHELPVPDAISAHQRPQLERYGPTLFVVLLPARYLDDVERVGCGELHLFVGVNFVITIPGGHRVPAGHPPVAGHVGRVGTRVRQVPWRRRVAP